MCWDVVCEKSPRNWQGLEISGPSILTYLNLNKRHWNKCWLWFDTPACCCIGRKPVLFINQFLFFITSFVKCPWPFCFSSWMLSHVLALGTYFLWTCLPFLAATKKKSFLRFPESTAGIGCMTAPSAQHHTETWLLALNKIVPDILFLLQINILKEFVFSL